MVRVTGQDSPDVRVERATIADAPVILEIHRRVLAEGEWFVTELDELHEGLDAKIAAIREAARVPGAFFLVARAGARAVGWAQATPGSRRRTRHVARLELMVDAPWRGSGVGRALLAAVVARARAAPQVYKLSLTVYAHNARALALYRSHGFVEEGRRRREYRFPDGSWRDDVLMALWVKPEGELAT